MAIAQNILNGQTSGIPYTPAGNPALDPIMRNQQKLDGRNATLPPAGSGTTPYEYFRRTNAPTTDRNASTTAANLLSGYQKPTYTPKSAQDYVPPEILAALGNSTQKLADFKPETVKVDQVQVKPVEYYQSQIDDLSKPLENQYSLARASARGDQAARGTLYDSQGYEDIGQLDKSFLDAVANITRGVQQQRMSDEQSAQTINAQNNLTEALNRRQTSLAGLTAGGNQANIASQFYGDLGGSEQNRAITSALQGLGLDTNLITSLLGYGADRYKTEGQLFSDVYGTDSTYNTERAKIGQQDIENKRGTLIDLINAQGYSGVPQEQLWEAIGQQILGKDWVQQTKPDSKQPTVNERLANGTATYDYRTGKVVDRDGRPIT